MAKEAWNFDFSRSSINFSVRHLMVSKVRGRFTTWQGLFELDEDDAANSRVQIQIDAASIDTNDGARDAYLRSVEFLDVDKYPFITFHSTKVERSDTRSFRLTGNLTIRDRAKLVVLDVKYAGRSREPVAMAAGVPGVRVGTERVAYNAKTAVSRQDFGLVWNVTLETGGFVVGDRVDIDVQIEATKA